MKQAIRECSGAIIKALAAIVNCPRTDEQLDADVIPRDPVMAHVMTIRDAMDKLSAAAQAETAQAAPACCQCPACAPVLHASDCAVHNAPALPVGPCDCGAAPGLVPLPATATKEMMVAAVKYANGDAVYKNVAAGALEIEEQIYGETWEAMVAAATPGATHGN